MDYWFSVTTPANTSKSEAIKTEMKVTEGIVTHVWIVHPRGCHGVAHATISDGLHQLWPTNPGESYYGDHFPMEFDEYYEVRRPAKLYLHTWNLSESYPHAVLVRITILPKRVASMIPVINLLTRLLQRMGVFR